MNLKQKLQSLTKALNAFSSSNSQANVKSMRLMFSDYKLDDETIIRVDGELAVGTLVYVVTEEGLLPAPDGAHSIPEVGVVTTEGGKIVDISAPEASEEIAVKAEEVEVETNVVENVDDKVAEIAQSIDELSTIVNDLVVNVTNEIEASKKRFSAIDTAISALAQVPTAAPKKRASDAVVESVKMSRESRMSELSQTLKTLKK